MGGQRLPADSLVLTQALFGCVTVRSVWHIRSRISENRLICDCNLQWLAIWLRRNPRLALFTKCAAPPHLRNRNIAELESRELKCPNVHGTHSVQGQAGHFALPSRSPDVVCSDVKPNCPESCWCTEDDLVDCRQRGLKRIPPDIPTAVTELLVPHTIHPHHSLTRCASS